MGVTKTDIHDQVLVNLAKIAKVLGHPARVAILEHISKVDGCVCGNLVEEIGLAQATISQHLRELKSIGLIKGSIEGTSVCYCIDFEQWEKVRSRFNLFFNTLGERNSNCC